MRRDSSRGDSQRARARRKRIGARSSREKLINRLAACLALRREMCEPESVARVPSYRATFTGSVFVR